MMKDNIWKWFWVGVIGQVVFVIGLIWLVISLVFQIPWSKVGDKIKEFSPTIKIEIMEK
jgi:hypothetical protein